MANQQVDTGLILPGWKGELYSDDGTFLAAVNTWTISFSVNNTDYYPAGSPIQVAIVVGLSQTLTLTETLVKDATLLKKLFDAIRLGNTPEFGFQGVIKGNNGIEARYVATSCVPDGSIDVANVSPGDILQRSWSFRVNDLIDPQSYLA